MTEEEDIAARWVADYICSRLEATVPLVYAAVATLELDVELDPADNGTTQKFFDRVEDYLDRARPVAIAKIWR